MAKMIGGLLGICTLLLSSLAIAQTACGTDDAAVKACVHKYLVDTNVIIGDKILDPGGTKTKAATLSCQYDCNTKRSDFDKKYRK